MSEPTIVLIVYGVVAFVILVVIHGRQKDPDADQLVEAGGAIFTATLWPLLLLMAAAVGAGFVLLYWLPRKIGVAVCSRIDGRHRVTRHKATRLVDTPAHDPVMPDWR